MQGLVGRRRLGEMELWGSWVLVKQALTGILSARSSRIQDTPLSFRNWHRSPDMDIGGPTEKFLKIPSVSLSRCLVLLYGRQ